MISGSGDGNQVTFELKVWDPAAKRSDKIPFRMLLSAYPIDSNTSEDGFEVPVSVDAFSRSVAITRMELSWRNGFVVLNAGRSSVEVLSYELNATITPVAYVSFVGNDKSLVAIRFPNCDQMETGWVKIDYGFFRIII